MSIPGTLSRLAGITDNIQMKKLQTRSRPATPLSQQMPTGARKSRIRFLSLSREAFSPNEKQSQFSMPSTRPPAGAGRTSRKKDQPKPIPGMRLKTQEQREGAISLRLGFLGLLAALSGFVLSGKRHQKDQAKPIFAVRHRAAGQRQAGVF